MLELWGGHECTVNRVRDAYGDQTVRSGHQTRPQDLELFAGLGLTALRYPVLWERVAPDSPDVQDWSWTDERLARIRQLGMRPIAGLLHHGSGPRYTSLISDNFVSGLARHARAAAERYPWIDDWTPVNEPLTTARFSALYGHWYPHAEDERTFWTALLNEIDGTRAAMAEIRRVNPNARLIQTEDLGQVYGTAPFAEEAAFQNQRRWITWDLLAGKVTRDHPLWARLDRFGFGHRLAAMADAPCPPDVLGVNFYITSERFLDHRAERYPQWVAGEQGQFDMDALRVLDPPPVGLDGLMRQAWARYGLPLAITESHLNSTRDEQMRWTLEAWALAQQLRDEGVDFRAVTVWALLGSFDWNSLLTKQAGFYEAGTFDVRSGAPRPTAMAGMLKRLAAGENLSWTTADPVLGGQGWWRRDTRLSLPVHRWGEAAPVSPPPPAAADRPTRPPLLIVGATGVLGRAFAEACQARDLPVVLAVCDLDDPESLARTLAGHRPWTVINTACWTGVDEAEVAPDKCSAVATGAANLAAACAQAGLHLTTFSSDQVFDGVMDRAYVEDDQPAPLTVYGRGCAAAEREVAAAHPGALIVRTGPLFKADDAEDFAGRVARTLQAGEIAQASDVHTMTPTYAPDLVNVTLDLIIDGETGLRHVANETAVSWLQFGRAVAAALRLDPANVQPATAAELGGRAARPRNVALCSKFGRLAPSLDDALSRFAEASGVAGRRAASLNTAATPPARDDFT